MKKIYIIGTSGSGKSYLAKKLSEKYRISHFDLDDIFWETKYTIKRSEEEKRKLVSRIIQNNKGWVIEGVFTSFVLEAIQNADEIIWLDLHPWLMSYRVILRSIKKIGKGTENLAGVKCLLNDIRSYKKEGGMYHKHKAMLERHEVEYILIQNKKQFENYLKTLE